MLSSLSIEPRRCGVSTARHETRPERRARPRVRRDGARARAQDRRRGGSSPARAAAAACPGSTRARARARGRPLLWRRRRPATTGDRRRRDRRGHDRWRARPRAAEAAVAGVRRGRRVIDEVLDERLGRRARLAPRGDGLVARGEPHRLHARARRLRDRVAEIDCRRGGSGAAPHRPAARRRREPEGFVLLAPVARLLQRARERVEVGGSSRVPRAPRRSCSTKLALRYPSTRASRSSSRRWTVLEQCLPAGFVHRESYGVEKTYVAHRPEAHRSPAPSAWPSTHGHIRELVDQAGSRKMIPSHVAARCAMRPSGFARSPPRSFRTTTPPYPSRWRTRRCRSCRRCRVDPRQVQLW